MVRRRVAADTPGGLLMYRIGSPAARNAATARAFANEHVRGVVANSWDHVDLYLRGFVRVGLQQTAGTAPEPSNLGLFVMGQEM